MARNNFCNNGVCNTLQDRSADMVKKFIMKDPMESEEVKWEESQNVMWSCPHHGKETYFNIKKLERQRKMLHYVYV